MNKSKVVSMANSPKTNDVPKTGEKTANATTEQPKLSYEQLEQIAQQQHQQLMQQRQQLMQMNMDHISFKMGISLEILKLDANVVFDNEFINSVTLEVQNEYRRLFLKPEADAEDNLSENIENSEK